MESLSRTGFFILDHSINQSTHLHLPSSNTISFSHPRFPHLSLVLVRLITHPIMLSQRLARSVSISHSQPCRHGRMLTYFIRLCPEYHPLFAQTSPDLPSAQHGREDTQTRRSRAKLLVLTWVLPTLPSPSWRASSPV